MKYQKLKVGDRVLFCFNGAHSTDWTVGTVTSRVQDNPYGHTLRIKWDEDGQVTQVDDYGVQKTNGQQVARLLTPLELAMD